MLHHAGVCCLMFTAVRVAMQCMCRGPAKPFVHFSTLSAWQTSQSASIHCVIAKNGLDFTVHTRVSSALFTRCNLMSSHTGQRIRPSLGWVMSSRAVRRGRCLRQGRRPRAPLTTPINLLLGRKRSRVLQLFQWRGDHSGEDDAAGGPGVSSLRVSQATGRRRRRERSGDLAGSLDDAR